jgi:hypothetical protein
MGESDTDRFLNEAVECLRQAEIAQSTRRNGMVTACRRLDEAGTRRQATGHLKARIGWSDATEAAIAEQANSKCHSA